MEHKKSASKYFNGNWYSSKGVVNKYNPAVAALIIRLIEEMKRENVALDYLLVVHMNGSKGRQLIKFSWEEFHGEQSINHIRTFEFEKEGSFITDKFYAVDDGAVCTILFPYEY